MKTIAAIILFSLVSCIPAKYINVPTEPTDIVIQGSVPMIIYYKKEILPTKYGQYKYYVNDATDKGFILLSFEKYEVGDTLILNKK